MCFKLGIWDWNGTLLNDIPLTYRCLAHVFGTFAPEATIPSRQAYQTEMNYSNILEFYHKYGIPPDITAQNIYDVWRTHYRSNVSQLVLYESAEDLLRFCKRKGAHNAIVSGAPDDSVDYLELLGIKKLFSKTIFDVKDKVQALKVLLAEFGVAPHEAFYADDTHTGVSAANSLGITTFGVAHGCDSAERIAEANPTHPTNSLREVFAILQNGQAA